jgi:hypothetical protein
MKITAFVDKIVDGFSRNATVNVHAAVVKEMNDTTIPVLETFIEYVESDSRAKKVISGFGKDFVTRLGRGGKGEFYDRILAAMNANVAQAGDVEDLIAKLIPKDADAQSLDGRAANLVQYVEIMGFTNRYLRHLLLSFTQDITKAIKGPDFKQGLTDSQLKGLQANMSAFATAISVLETAASGVDRAIKNIPEFNVALTDIDAMTAANGAAKMDPLGTSGFFSADWNPILAVRMLYEDRIIANYQGAKEDRQALEYRIQALKDSKDGTTNPRLEETINYHTGRLKEVNKKIEKYEASVKEPSK